MRVSASVETKCSLVVYPELFFDDPVDIINLKENKRFIQQGDGKGYLK